MVAAYHLRLYSEEDEEAAILLWHDTWQQTYPDIDFSVRLPWWRARWCDELVPIAQIVVAESDEELVGFVTIDVSGYLDQLVVAKAHQGSPLAKALLDEAKRLSPSGINLKVNADNAHAIGFYQRNGFVHDGDEVNEASGRAVWRMSWEPQIP